MLFTRKTLAEGRQEGKAAEQTNASYSPSYISRFLASSTCTIRNSSMQVPYNKAFQEKSKGLIAFRGVFLEHMCKHMRVYTLFSFVTNNRDLHSILFLLATKLGLPDKTSNYVESSRNVSCSKALALEFKTYCTGNKWNTEKYAIKFLKGTFF